MVRTLASVALLAVLVWVPAAAQDRQITGVVVDASGAPVSGAVVEVDVGGNQEGQVASAADGSFAVSGVPVGSAFVIARADGFADAVVAVTAPSDRVLLVLYPAPIFDTVTVTASLGAPDLQTPASSSVLSSADIAILAGGNIDDKLLYTPGFSLFRRQSSRVANPTTQGVTLRGVSGSGASRTKVLADGMSLNDPFGNWVYWNRIPEAAVDRVEVVRGGAGDLYGETALGGVIQILTLAPERATVRATIEGGSLGTAKASAFAGGQVNRWSYEAAGEFTETNGYVIVAADERGAADVEAFSNYGTGYGGIGYASPSFRGRLRYSQYDEDRGNGTPVQVNNTKWKNFSGELTGTTSSGVWTVRASGGTQFYYQTFSAVIRARSEERLVRGDDTNTDFFSVSGQWVQPVGEHIVLLGGDTSRSDGVLDTTRFSFGTGLPTGMRQFGGKENGGSVFGQVSLAVNDTTTVRLGARGELWRTDPLLAQDPKQSANFFSPRVAISHLLRSDVQLQVSFYRSHRAPTLNELYRGFQVGSIVTNPNPLLDPERLTGVEGGGVFTRGLVSARVTVFFHQLDDPIANVTIGTNLRQRQNADRIRAAGAEIEADFRPHRTVDVRAKAAFTRSSFSGTDVQPQLDGKTVPQVPHWQLGGSITYSDPAYLTASVQTRGVGEQFDDDLNEFPLGAFGVVDFFASRTVLQGLNVFFAAENLFDQEYDVRFNPRSIGWPQTFRGGVRVTWP